MGKCSCSVSPRRLPLCIVAGFPRMLSATERGCRAANYRVVPGQGRRPLRSSIPDIVLLGCYGSAPESPIMQTSLGKRSV